MSRRGHKNDQHRLTARERAHAIPGCSDWICFALLPGGDHSDACDKITAAIAAHARDMLPRAKRRRHEYVIGPMVTGTLDKGGGLVITDIDNKRGVITCETAKRKAVGRK